MNHGEDETAIERGCHGAKDLSADTVSLHMVVKTERDDMTWYKCEVCGMMFDDENDAKHHEANCDNEDPSYIQ